jgi:hypothetical protein
MSQNIGGVSHFIADMGVVIETVSAARPLYPHSG